MNSLCIESKRALEYKVTQNINKSPKHFYNHCHLVLRGRTVLPSLLASRCFGGVLPTTTEQKVELLSQTFADILATIGGDPSHALSPSEAQSRTDAALPEVDSYAKNIIKYLGGLRPNASPGTVKSLDKYQRPFDLVSLALSKSYLHCPSIIHLFLRYGYSQGRRQL